MRQAGRRGFSPFSGLVLIATGVLLLLAGYAASLVSAEGTYRSAPNRLRPEYLSAKATGAGSRTSPRGWRSDSGRDRSRS